MKEDLGGVGEGKEHDQNILQKIPKYQITSLKEKILKTQYLANTGPGFDS